MSEKKTAHYVITRVFNNHFNKFISKGGDKKSIGKIITGGDMTIGMNLYNIFNRPAFDLESARERFLREYNDKAELTRNDIKGLMGQVLGVYLTVASYSGMNKSHRDFILDCVVDEGKEFCKEIDGIFGLKKYERQVEDIPVIRSYVSDFEFSKKFFGKATGFKGKTEKEIEEKLEEGDKDTAVAAEELAEEAYISESDAKLETERPSNVTIRILLDEEPFGTKFVIKKVNETEIYTVGKYKTNSYGEYVKKLFEGNYVIEVPNEEGLPSKKKFGLGKSELEKLIVVKLDSVEEEEEVEEEKTKEKKVPLLRKILCGIGLHSFDKEEMVNEDDVVYLLKYTCKNCGFTKKKRP
jgi:hypothetical protein